MAATHVEIKDGSYRNNAINGTFEIVKPFKVTDDETGAGHITVAEPIAPYKEGRIKVENEESLRYCDSEGNDAVKATPVIINKSVTGPAPAPQSSFEIEFRNLETEAEAMERIGRAFDVLEELTIACKDGHIKGMIVSGAPGIGKSYGVIKALEGGSLLDQMGPDGKYEVVKGNITPIQLYQMLWNHRHEDHIIVFDDCDIVLEDPVCLNLLKAVLDSGEKREVSWLSESKALAERGIDNHFEFEGCVLFLSNLDFDNVRANSKIGRHLEALRSRVLYLDLEISTMEDIKRRIKQVVMYGMLDQFKFTDEVKDEVVEFVFDNAEHLYRLDLRTVLKVAGLRRTSPNNWEEYSFATTMRKEALYEYRLKQKKAELAEKETKEEVVAA